MREFSLTQFAGIKKLCVFKTCSKNTQIDFLQKNDQCNKQSFINKPATSFTHWRPQMAATVRLSYNSSGSIGSNFCQEALSCGASPKNFDQHNPKSNLEQHNMNMKKKEIAIEEIGPQRTLIG